MTIIWSLNNNETRERDTRFVNMNVVVNNKL